MATDFDWLRLRPARPERAASVGAEPDFADTQPCCRLTPSAPSAAPPTANVHAARASPAGPRRLSSPEPRPRLAPLAAKHD